MEGEVCRCWSTGSWMSRRRLGDGWLREIVHCGSGGEGAGVVAGGVLGNGGMWSGVCVHGGRGRGGELSLEDAVGCVEGRGEFGVC